jgi:hypothetical protein
MGILLFDMEENNWIRHNEEMIGVIDFGLYGIS